MSTYTDINTPVVEKIILPSGDSFWIADRQIRDVVATLSDTVAGGVSYIVAWDGTSTPVIANIPAGVTVTYSGTQYTGTLTANSATPGAFYLVKSSTTPTSETLDIYDEYIPIGESGSKTWQKIGDTKLNLTDVVKNVTLNKSTVNVITSNATISHTDPTLGLQNKSSSGTGVVQVGSGTGTIAIGDGDVISAITGLGTASTDTAIGTNSTFTITQPTITPAISSTASGSAKVVTNVTHPGNKYIKGTATGASVSHNSNDAVSAITALSELSTDTFLKSVSSTSKKLATTSITGVSGSTTASKVTTTSQTTATGGTTTSAVNTNILKNISIQNKVLTFGACTLNTQTTNSASASNVTVPKAASATTVATGKTVTSDTNGDTVVVTAGNGTTASAATGFEGAHTTDSVVGSSSTYSVTQPTITLSSDTTQGAGKVQVVTGDPTVTYGWVTATATGANTAWKSKDTVTAVTGYSNPTKENVLGEDTTATFTGGTEYIGIKVITNGSAGWGNKTVDTVLTDDTTVTFDKIQSQS